jgi:glyoxylase-like metal-dependent hydrolase (beta-lactamase superfamily II)
MTTRKSRPLSILSAMILASITATAQSAAPVQSSGYDISGAWFNVYQGSDGNATVPLVAYGGYPLNEAGRLYALTWSPSRMTLRQQQCAQYSPHFLLHGGGNYRFWEDRDPYTQKLISVKMYGQITEGTRTVWMDGRPHPPAYAPHTFLGFSTGKYEGNALTVYTTHMKRNWIKANGMTQSDQATLVEHFIRHGDRITYVTVLTDPVYLSEPLIRTSDLGRSLRNPDAWLYACDDGEQLVGRPKDQIPNYLYGKNPYLHEFSDKYGIPLLADLGGPETSYPDFLAKIKDPAATDAAANAELFPTAGPPHTSKAVDPNPNDGEIHVFPVQGNIYLLAGEDANIAVQVGEQGALVVDTGSGKLADKVIAAIKKLIGDKPIQFIVNTSFHSDHTGGNIKVHGAGSDPSLVGSFFSIGGQSFADAGVGSTVIAHQNVQTRMSAPAGKASLTPPESWPSDTFLEGRRRKYYNDEAVEVLWEPNASTDGDTIVHFRRSDVIVTGDIFTTTQYPFIDVANGGSVQGFMDALNNILDRTVYKHEGEGGTMIVPGHGRICDEYEVSEYRDMLGVIRDRVQAMIDSGATLQQVKSARLTADYDDRYGANTGAWTTDMFVDSVYTSLKQGRPKARATK